MSTLRVDRYAAVQYYTTVGGEVRQYSNSVVRYRVLKLHHPDADELAEIRAELAAGATKTATCRRHCVGSVPRLNRLLAKDTAGGAGADGPILR